MGLLALGVLRTGCGAEGRGPKLVVNSFVADALALSKQKKVLKKQNMHGVLAGARLFRHD